MPTALACTHTGGGVALAAIASAIARTETTRDADDLAPILVGVAAVDALAGEIDDRRRAVELLCPRAEAAPIPRRLRARHRRGAGRSREHDDVVSLSAKVCGERAADEATSAGDHDAGRAGWRSV